MTDEKDHPILLFDGVCNLCQGTVQWVIKRDQDARFRFASLQSDVGSRLLEEAGEENDLDTVILIVGDRVYRKSGAALQVLGLIGGIYLPLLVFWAVPRFLRDWAYDQVARRRYRLFGKEETCMIPTPELRERFLE